MTTSLREMPFSALPGIAPAGYDELWQRPGSAHPHQERLRAHLAEYTQTELDELRRAVRRRVTEQEVTFNILGVPEGTNRPWELDPIPHVIPPEEWETLSRGLEQRARLLNYVLADCYGPQRLLQRGLIPPQLVLGNPNYARACHGWEPPERDRLHLLAIDVARAADGSFFVCSDRPTALTGSGYALENRLVLGRTLADLFRGYRVQRLSAFFDQVRRTVEAIAPRRTAEPRVVLLSAGTQDETSFEHAYLARYLGYELVEGRDLTVRDDAVYLKTLSGLRKVDVVLRRVHDALCDPLYLREDSTQGVAGLVAAARLGQVALANPLGSNLLESPAFKAYLPAVCQEVFGEPLALDATTTLWLGEPAALARVLDAPEQFVVKPAFSDRRGEPLRAASMSIAEKETLQNVLRARPGWYVAEIWNPLSSVPLLRDGAPAQGELALRTFLCRTDSSYVVMPGGLARVDSARDGVFLSLRVDRASKDVWIPSNRSTGAQPLPAMPDKRVELQRGGVDLPSRLLDDVYWLGRYVERAESTARVARAGLERLTLESPLEAGRALPAILDALRGFGVIPPTVQLAPDSARSAPKTGNAAAEAVLMGVLFDPNSKDGLRQILKHLHRLTLGVRSRLSRDAWHVLRRLSSLLDEESGLVGGEAVGDAIELLDELLVVIAAVSGTAYDNMVRGRVWTFMDMGRRVERGTMMLTLLQAALPAGAARVNMEALLEIADSLLTYRARYLSSLQAAPVVDLLLTDDTNPRSVAFQVNALASHLERLPRPGEAVRSRAERRLIALQSSLLTADVEQACGGDGAGLRALIEDAAVLLWQFSDDLSTTWFSHARPSRAVAPPRWINEDLEAG